MVELPTETSRYLLSICSGGVTLGFLFQPLLVLPKCFCYSLCRSLFLIKEKSVFEILVLPCVFAIIDLLLVFAIFDSQICLCTCLCMGSTYI